MLASQLLVNPNTIAKAYAELSREKVIEARPGRGVFIAPPRELYTAAERHRRLAPLLEAVVSEGISLGFKPGELVALLEQAADQATADGA